jgi:Fe-S-cluster containining protein
MVACMSDDIAEICWDPKTKQILRIVFFQRGLRFRCKRCAVYCCRLGGPEVTREDVERLRRLGYNVKDFLNTTGQKKFKQQGVIRCALKNKEDGSCVFLQFDKENNVYKCSVYEQRPTLCKLYPFDFQRIGANSVILKLIPCCNGLNQHDGDLVNKKFIERQLFKTILQLIG